MIILAYLAPVFLFFTLLLCALYLKRHVRASFKGPFASFSVEFEADDKKYKPEP